MAVVEAVLWTMLLNTWLSERWKNNAETKKMEQGWYTPNEIRYNYEQLKALCGQYKKPVRPSPGPLFIYAFISLEAYKFYNSIKNIINCLVLSYKNIFFLTHKYNNNYAYNTQNLNCTVSFIHTVCYSIFCGVRINKNFKQKYEFVIGLVWPWQSMASRQIFLQII